METLKSIWAISQFDTAQRHLLRKMCTVYLLLYTKLISYLKMISLFVFEFNIVIELFNFNVRDLCRSFLKYPVIKKCVRTYRKQACFMKKSEQNRKECRNHPLFMSLIFVGVFYSFLFLCYTLSHSSDTLPLVWHEFCCIY